MPKKKSRSSLGGTIASVALAGALACPTICSRESNFSEFVSDNNRLFKFECPIETKTTIPSFSIKKTIFFNSDFILEDDGIVELPEPKVINTNFSNVQIIPQEVDFIEDDLEFYDL